ncbi:hypothetical protein GIV40_00280 [Pseudomonas poae]|uniref:hypothetical protein n=1 Tax=Pseudomonas poae TaxID=200451 RepID=UPI001F48D2D6|nr:hypothetical protein [Pseudomonas poae]MCF5775524.1 hypothetical protein [Pseudomonas poae]
MQNSLPLMVMIYDNKMGQQMHAIENYKTVNASQYRVLVVRIVSPSQILESGPGSIHQLLIDEGLDKTVGLYFYRFQNLSYPAAFSKIGEVSREDGVIVRKKRGWLSPDSYGDSYLKRSSKGERKIIYDDVNSVRDENPMYFTFYEFDIEASFPKIDEIAAFRKHLEHFGCSTRNREAVNTFSRLGSKLVWYEESFNEVLNLRLPSGISYEEAIKSMAAMKK